MHMYDFCDSSEEIDLFVDGGMVTTTYPLNQTDHKADITDIGRTKLPDVFRRNSSASSVASTTSSGSSSASGRANRDLLAMKLHQNWLEKDPDLKEFDDSLTNLTWLQSMNPLKLENDGSQGSSPTHHEASARGTNNTIARQGGSTKALELLNVKEREDYRANSSMKPPYSYATLICMAIRELGKSKITLSDIYAWITDNFMYYRVSDSSWQNSVRHNLSLNKCFEKVPRRKDEPGKGGFWRINPKYADVLANGMTKRRRTLPNIPTSHQHTSSFRSTLQTSRHSTFHHPSNIKEELRHRDHTTSQGLVSPPTKRARKFRAPSTPFGAEIANPTPPRYFRRQVSNLAVRLPHVEEYKTSETSTKVDTQMRDFSQLSLAPVTDPLNQMIFGGMDNGFEDLFGDRHMRDLPETPGDSSSTGEEFSFTGDRSPTDDDEIHAENTEPTNALRSDISGLWGAAGTRTNDNVNWDELPDLDSLLGLN